MRFSSGQPPASPLAAKQVPQPGQEAGSLPVSNPAFICIGAQKAGTQWLYDQAASHPEAWMPPIKELRYFLPAFPTVQERARLLLGRAEERGRGRIARDDRNVAFLQRLVSAKRDPQAADLSDYVSLFEPAGSLITGDITPGYHSLGEDVVTLLASGLPHCKFIYLVRDPIERLWSHANMRVRGGLAAPSILTDASEFAAQIRQNQFVQYSFQSDPIMRWSEIVGGDRFRVFVMEDMRDDAVEYRRAVFAFIGLDADECRIEAGYNKKEGNAKVPMPSEHRTVLLEYFDREYERLQPYIAQSRELRRARSPHS